MRDSGFHRVRALGGMFSALTGAENLFRGHYSIHVLALRMLPACGGARASLPRRCIARLHGAHTGSGGLRGNGESVGQCDSNAQMRMKLRLAEGLIQP